MTTDRIIPEKIAVEDEMLTYHLPTELLRAVWQFKEPIKRFLLSIAIGKDAELVIFDEDIQVQQVFVQGIAFK